MATGWGPTPEARKLFYSLDHLLCAAAFVQRTGVSTGVVDRKKTHNRLNQSTSERTNQPCLSPPQPPTPTLPHPHPPPPKKRGGGGQKERGGGGKRKKSRKRERKATNSVTFQIWPCSAFSARNLWLFIEKAFFCVCGEEAYCICHAGK